MTQVTWRSIASLRLLILINHCIGISIMEPNYSWDPQKEQNGAQTVLSLQLLNQLINLIYWIMERFSLEQHLFHYTWSERHPKTRETWWHLPLRRKWLCTQASSSFRCIMLYQSSSNHSTLQAWYSAKGYLLAQCSSESKMLKLMSRVRSKQSHQECRRKMP